MIRNAKMNKHEMMKAHRKTMDWHIKRLGRCWSCLCKRIKIAIKTAKFQTALQKQLDKIIPKQKIDENIELMWVCIELHHCHLELDGVVKTLKEWRKILKHTTIEGCHCYLTPLDKNK